MSMKIKVRLKEAYRRLIASKEYKEHTPEKSFLSSAFVIIDAKDINIDHWNFNFYNEETGKIVSFSVAVNKIEYKETSPRVSDKIIKHLELDFIKVPPKKAILMTLEKAKEKLHGEATKMFLTLHNNEDHRNPVWTITAMSTGLDFFKMRVDALEGTIVSSEVKHLFQLSR